MGINVKKIFLLVIDKEDTKKRDAGAGASLRD